VAIAVEHRYRPRGSALAVFKCRAGEVVMSGGAGTGKSRACLEKMHLAALATSGMRGLIVRKTLASLGSTALVTWREHVIKESLIVGEVEFYGGSSQEAPQYRYRNGSVVVIGGIDKASKIMSSEYDLIYVQEAIELTENDWESLTTRLRNGKLTYQQIISDTNPDRPTHWLNQRIEKKQTEVIWCRHEDNPRLYDDAGEPTPDGASYIAKLDRLTGVRKARLRYGKWVAAEGLVYDEYDPETHLLQKPKQPPASWPRVWSVDFGFINPFVCQMWCIDPDDQLILFREIYHTRRTVDEHAKTVIKSVTIKDHDYQHPKDEARFAYHGRIWREPKPIAVVCDHDAEGRVVFERETGLSTINALKTVVDGIQAVQMRMRIQANGLPGIGFVRDVVVERDAELAEAGRPTSTIEEISGYVWARDASGKVQKEQPAKMDDHGMDAMRYVVAYRDLAPRPRVRWM